MQLIDLWLIRELTDEEALVIGQVLKLVLAEIQEIGFEESVYDCTRDNEPYSFLYVTIKFLCDKPDLFLGDIESYEVVDDMHIDFGKLTLKLYFRRLFKDMLKKGLYVIPVDSYKEYGIEIRDPFETKMEKFLNYYKD